MNPQPQLLKLIIVDDDHIVRFLHSSLMEQYGIDPVICANGQEAFDFLDSDSSQQEVRYLVLLDLNMPVLNGWEFLEHCRAKPYADRVQVIVVTSSTYQGDLSRALEYNEVIGFCRKPLRKKNIRAISRMEEIRELWSLVKKQNVVTGG